MATKKIVASVMLHRPDKDFVPFEFDGLGARVKGNYRIEEVAPGTPTDLDADEADRLIEAGLAEEVKKAEKAAPTPPPAA